MRGRPGVTFREELALGSLIESSLAPLGTRTTRVSAARVRAAVRWERTAPPRLGLIGLLAKSVQSVAAAGLAAVMLAGSLHAASPEAVRAPSVVDAYFRSRPPLDEGSYLRWLRLVARESATDDVLDLDTVLIDRR